MLLPFLHSLHLNLLHFNTPKHTPLLLHHTQYVFPEHLVMFDFLFGWRKASKCERLMRGIQCRLKLIISKRIAIVRQVRDDVAQLLKVGHEHDDHTIFTRVEQLYMDEIIITVYELLGHFSEFITINLPYIRRHRDCPNDVNEAISSLVFASARCGDLPELTISRELFEERYGRRFVRTALDLLPGNLVNSQIKEKLSITSVSDEAKLRLVNEIFRDYCLQSGSLAMQYNPEWHQKQQMQANVNCALVPDKPIQDVKEVQREATDWASASNTQSEDCFSLQANDLIMYTNGNHPTTLLPAQDSVMHQKVTKMEDSAHISRMPSSSSCSDISVHIPDENLIYLDDIQELRSPKLYDCSSPDKTVFKFKSSPLVIARSGHDDHPSITRQRLRKSFVNRDRKFRKRSSSSLSSSRESVNLRQDVNFKDRYCKNSYQEWTTIKTNPHRQEMHQWKVLENETGPFLAKRGVIFQSQPDLITEQAKGINKPSGVIEKKTIFEDNMCSPESSNGSNSLESAPLNKSVALTYYVKDAETRYLRAFTMPAEQTPKDQPHEMYSRTRSLPGLHHVNHVHPKLPNYDQIQAKFSALKQDYQHSHLRTIRT